MVGLPGTSLGGLTTCPTYHLDWSTAWRRGHPSGGWSPSWNKSVCSTSLPLRRVCGCKRHTWPLCHCNKGRVARHAAINDFVHRAFVKAGIPAVKEPTGLLPADGKRPDGCTLCHGGKCLAWDVPDTLARSYLHMVSLRVRRQSKQPK